MELQLSTREGIELKRGLTREGDTNRTRLLTRGVGFFVDPPKRWPVFSFKIRLQFPLGFILPLSRFLELGRRRRRVW